jgi:hypothetical protein
MKFDKDKILSAINEGEFGCKRESVIKLMEAVTGEELKGSKFPCLMKENNTNSMYIITENTDGRYSGLKFVNINGTAMGYYDENWFPTMKPFTGKVILQNKDGKLDVTVTN